MPLERVLAPPYDVVERDEALALARADEHNVVRLVLPEGTDPPASAAATLADWLDQGVLRVDDRAALYVYEQADTAGVPRQRGLIGALALTGPDSRAVLPHEDVMPGPVEDRTRLMAATGANLEPIWLLYRGATGVASAVVESVASHDDPLAEAVTSDGTRHRLWAVIDAATLAAVADDLAGRQALIADGHHRHAAYRRVQAQHRAVSNAEGPWDRGLALLVDLERHPPALAAIHRHVAGLSLDAVRANPVDGITLADAPEARPWPTALSDAPPGAVVLVDASGAAWLLRVTDAARVDASIVAALEGTDIDRPQRWRRLDTVVLHRLLLPAWGTTEPQVTYHHDATHAVGRTRTDGGLAVLLSPVDVADVFGLAELGVRMPRKSTSFGPKPRSGLVLRTFAADGDVTDQDARASLRAVPTSTS